METQCAQCLKRYYQVCYSVLYLIRKTEERKTEKGTRNVSSCDQRHPGLF